MAISDPAGSPINKLARAQQVDTTAIHPRVEFYPLHSPDRGDAFSEAFGDSSAREHDVIVAGGAPHARAWQTRAC
jgi:hypothetical protein